MKVKIDGYEIEGGPQEVADLLWHMKPFRRRQMLQFDKRDSEVITAVPTNTKSKTKLKDYGLRCVGVNNQGDRCNKHKSKHDGFCFMHSPDTNYKCLTKGIYFNDKP
jgi:hypothetical protein